MPATGPFDLSDNWKSALRKEMVELRDWRTPQIIACEARREDWEQSTVGCSDRTEVRIRCDDQEEVYERVIAFLGSYRKHHYTRSDGDPWDLARTKPHNGERPCILPKPPKVANVTLAELESELEEVRRDGWCLGGLYYFIPPADWKPGRCAKNAWRNRGAFRRARTTDGIHYGPIDFEGRVWRWDTAERHWDVQLVAGGYLSINQTGRRLK